MPLRKRIKSSSIQQHFLKRLLEGGKVAMKTPIIARGLFVVFISAFFCTWDA
jgi:hypothetical protein